MYTVDYFINFFEAIPEDRWTVFIQRDSHGNRCAYGHCVGKSYYEFQELDKNCSLKVTPVNDYVHFQMRCFANINNGVTREYQQPTPKQRILAALHDIKKLQQPEYKDITSELAILPINETADQPTQILHL